ncbi:CLUMA_CG006625, isoform A [Clunio marinus]|uniref:CLUMA_CG006625, isoform A n=1 Tax=Clunio marinus TaxID=568069 RepID=A0A1J1I3X7_9DIPT|nr:CLUMA_CG006625, isoform A [Clunio marinus]
MYGKIRNITSSTTSEDAILKSHLKRQGENHYKHQKEFQENLSKFLENGRVFVETLKFRSVISGRQEKAL